MKDKTNIKIILAMVTTILISGLINVSGSGMFNSHEVIYENELSGLTSTNVQGAVDELYAVATDYTNINNRVNKLEKYFNPNTTNYFYGTGSSVNLGGTTAGAGSQAFLNLYYQGTKRGRIFSGASVEGITIQGTDADGNDGQGSVTIQGSPITLNGTDVSTYITTSPSTKSFTKNGLSIFVSKLGRVVDVYIYGTTSSQINSSEAYVTLANMGSTFAPKTAFITFQLLTSTIDGQLKVDSNGVMQIGYTKLTNSTASTNLASGLEIYAHTSYISNS